jgi:hypothetical protein
MALATAPERLRGTTAPAGVPDTVTPSRRAIEVPARRGPRWTLQQVAAMCGALVVGSLLMVVGASAYLTQGQVRLTRMQQQLTSELGRHHDLELRVAQLANPSSVVSQAQRHGLTAPTGVTDLPQFVPSSTTAATRTPAAGQASTHSTSAR